MTVTVGVALALLVVGAFFLIVAAVGFVRLPDVYCRLHVVGVIDTLGAPSILLACGVYLLPVDPLVSGKLVLGIVFLFATSPLVGHLLARAALEAGEEAEVTSVADEPADRLGAAPGGAVERRDEPPGSAGRGQPSPRVDGGAG